MKTKSVNLKYKTMQARTFVILFLLGILSTCRNGNKVPVTYPKTGSVEVSDPRLNEIIEPGAQPEILADSFLWSEGPLWVPELNAVLFSDIPQNSIYQWSEKEGLKLYLKPSGYTGEIPRGGETGSNGLLLDANGRLVLCQHGERRMARMDAPLDKPKPEFTSLADRWQGKRFNSPNDAVFSRKGDLYFTDPAYGMELKWEDPAREIAFAGVYRLSPGGKVGLLVDTLEAPNGIALSPDEKRLFVASSGSDASWYVYEVREDGSLGGGKVFYDAREPAQSRRGSPDGMVIREDGILFAAGPGGVLIFDPEGNLLGTILTGQLTSNCTLDEEGQFLYMTADMFLMRIGLK